MYELWLEMWDYFFNNPWQALLIFAGVVAGIYALYFAAIAIAQAARYRRWAKGRVFYLNGSGELYLKDRSKDYDK